MQRQAAYTRITMKSEGTTVIGRAIVVALRMNHGCER
jgi:hypothetical protein